MDHIWTPSHMSSYESMGAKLDIGRKWTGKTRCEMEGLKGKLGISGLLETFPINYHNFSGSKFHGKATFTPLTQMGSREWQGK